MPLLVSVILTVYKRTEYLAEALRSALNQFFPDFEIIVADDSGTAAAREIVANFGDGGRVKYLSNPTTLGVARSLVRAVGEARGRYIAILNDDDILLRPKTPGPVAGAWFDGDGTSQP